MKRRRRYYIEQDEKLDAGLWFRFLMRVAAYAVVCIVAIAVAHWWSAK